jgi:multidrug efflux pump subunit AcrA (membrane-fusion protein)
VSKKRVLLVAAGAAIIAVAVWLAVRNGREASASPPQVVAAERGPIKEVVSATGRVVPSLEVEIKSKASGEVVSVPCDVSDKVEKGDLLVELDPVDEQRRVTQAEVALAASRAQVELKRNVLEVAQRTLATDRKKAEAALAAAEAHAADARAKAERMKLLLQKKLASQEDRDTAETAAIQAETELKNARVRLEELETQELALEGGSQNVRLAEAQVASDEVTLADARKRLAETRVLSPIRGVVSSRNVEIGQIVSSGISNVGGGTTLLTVADLARMFVLASVDESDIGRVEVGQAASVTVDAHPEEVFSGEVRRIAAKGQNNANVVTFEVKIEVTDRKRGLLKPEMTATVEVIIARADDALLVPAQAVVRDRGGSLVLVGDGKGEPERRPVEIGVMNEMNAQITNGLAEGEQVLLSSGTVDSRWRRERGPERRGLMPFGGGRRGRR